MNCVFLIISEKELHDLFALNIRSFLNLEIKTFESSSNVLLALKEQKERPCAIIASCEMEGDRPAKILHQYISASELSIPIISLGDDPHEEVKEKPHLMVSIDEKDDVKEVLRHLTSILGLSVKDLASAPGPKYFSVPLDHFFGLEQSPCDVFLKIGKGELTQYLKRIHAGDGLEDEAAQRYHKNGVKNLYIQSQRRLTFVDKMTDYILDTLNAPQSSDQEILKAAELAQANVAKNIESLGLSPKLIQMSDKAIGKMIEQGQKHPKLKGLLEKLVINKSSFAFMHSQLACYLSMAILKVMDWGKEEQFKTISFVSFFHDISIPDYDLAKIHSDKELSEAKLNARQEEKVKRHAQLSTKLIHNYPGMPMGADTIIRQHHGILNGLGFSNNFSGNLTPLAIIFIVAEECAHLVLKNDIEILNKRKIIFELEQKFKTSRFQKMLDALEDVLT